MKLSIIVPVYNEEKTIRKVLQEILKKKFGMEKEVIVVNDGSKDETLMEIKKIKNKSLRTISYSENKGKGYALRIGFAKARGEIVAIQDADLEYSLKDLKKLVEILIKEKLKVVYGSRFLDKNEKYKMNSFYIGNRVLSFITSLLYFHKITDMETCYKVFRKEVLRGMDLECNRFDIEPEITSKFLKKKVKIGEIPIDYSPRTAKEGKKIKWKDGLSAIWVLIRERFS